MELVTAAELIAELQQVDPRADVVVDVGEGENGRLEITYVQRGGTVYLSIEPHFIGCGDCVYD